MKVFRINHEREEFNEVSKSPNNAFIRFAQERDAKRVCAGKFGNVFAFIASPDLGFHEPVKKSL